MSEKEVSAQQIVDKLNDIMEYNQEFGHQDITQSIKLFAKLIFNLQFDMDELKIELIKALKDEGECEVNHKPEEEDGRFYT